MNTVDSLMYLAAAHGADPGFPAWAERVCAEADDAALLRLRAGLDAACSHTRAHGRDRAYDALRVMREAAGRESGRREDAQDRRWRDFLAAAQAEARR